MTVIVQCPDWNHGANRPCRNPVLYFIQGPWRHCTSNHNNERCAFNIELFAGRDLRVPLLVSSTPERMEMLVLEDNMTDEEARDFINSSRSPYETAGATTYTRYPLPLPAGHHPTQNTALHPPYSTSYRPSNLNAEQLRVINRPGPDHHFHSIQRFNDGSAWVRWERD